MCVRTLRKQHSSEERRHGKIDKQPIPEPVTYALTRSFNHASYRIGHALSSHIATYVPGYNIMVLCVPFVAPGAFNVSNITFVSSREVNITSEEVSACTYIHSTSVPLSVTHMSLYVHMKLNGESGETWSVLP